MVVSENIILLLLYTELNVAVRESLDLSSYWTSVPPLCTLMKCPNLVPEVFLGRRWPGAKEVEPAWSNQKLQLRICFFNI